MKRALFSLLVIILLVLMVTSGFAQDEGPVPTREPGFEDEILVRLRSIDPNAVPYFKAGTRALDLGDYEVARWNFNMVLEHAPDFPDALRRLSYVEAVQGESEAALVHARRAYEIDPTPYNQSNLALVLIYQDNTARSFEAFKHAQAAAAALPDDAASQITLLLAAGETENYDVARQAAENAVRLEPQNPLVHFYIGLLDAMDGRWESAERELVLSRELGMPAEDIQQVLDDGVTSQAQLYRLGRYSVYVLIAWLVALLLLFLVGLVLSKMTLSAIHRSTKPVTIGMSSPQYQVSGHERLLRRLYSLVIAITSAYFYISIPFLILVIVAFGAAIFYLFNAIGYIPIRGAVFLGLMVLYTLFAIVRSIFTRIKDVDPGRPLLRDESPWLWSLTEEVARCVQTRPVDAIYITPSAEIAVRERGGIVQKTRGNGQRCLILGLGVLEGMTQGELKAILAHEYGHFSNRDTAGGQLATQVQASLMHLALRLARAGQAHWFNPVWWFVNGFYRVYKRVTLGASRLQEVLADRYAVIAYGARDFIDGLTHVIQRSISFEMQAGLALQAAVEGGSPVRNLYNLPPLEPGELKTQVDEKIAEEMQRPTSPYDSHPGYQERVRLAQEVRGASSLGGDNRPAIDLFSNYEVLQAEMTEVIRQRIEQNK